MMKRKSILRIKLIYIFIGIIIIIIPNIPYKLPIKINNSSLTELELTLDSGGYYVKHGSENLEEYAIQNGYSKVDLGLINLTDDNIINKTLVCSVQGGEGIIKYDKIRVYGEIIGSPDKYGILTFNVHEWYPMNKYVAIKDTNIWNNAYKIFYFSFILIIIIVVLIININKKIVTHL